MTSMPEQQISQPLGERHWYQRVFDGNGLMWVLYFAFIIVSLVTVSSAISSDFYKSLSAGGMNPIMKHWIMLVIGGTTAVVMSSLPARYYRVHVPLLMTIGMVVMIIALILFGRATNGAERWINLGFITLQPSEFMRVYMVLCGALIAKNDLVENPKKEKAYYVYWIALLLLSTPLILSNLSTGIIFVAFLFLYSWVLKAPKRAMRRFALVGAGGVALFAIALFTFPDSLLPSRATTWRNRIERAVSEREDRFQITDENRQEQMGRIAIARSQLIGKGPGNSKIRDTLAMAYSDYLYAIIIEEYGLIGLLFIPGLYVIWMLLAYREARKQTNVYRSNLIKGFGILYPMQAIINMVVASGLISTGQTLPLLSFGGSSIVAASMAFGIMIGASRVDKDKRRQREEEALIEEETTTLLEV